MKNLFKLSTIALALFATVGCTQDKVTKPDSVPEPPPGGVSAPPMDDKPTLEP